MTVVGIDDTDSREYGMCTTYLGARIATRFEREGGEEGNDGESETGTTVRRRLLVRLNPAVEHKTRGNAAVAIHTDLDPERAFEIAREELDAAAETDDPNTNPGLVVAPGNPAAVDDSVARFAREALRTHHDIADAERLADEHGFRRAGWKNGRGTIGALAAVGAWVAFDEWTCEHISYREEGRWGTPREVDFDSLFDAATDAYPEAWDTVDCGESDAVCVPRTPCPVLHGVRGDDPDAVSSVAASVESEPVARSALFVTNQGTDAHLADAALADVEDGRAYRVDGTVATEPETRVGGHVFFTLSDGDESLRCAAFEPTKRFRDRVRALRPGDRLTACGEVSESTLKLEKFAVRELNETELVTPDCPDCGRSMKSAGAGQGYRCRDCGTSAPGKVERPVERDLEPGWYEVPPTARRHVAKPLVRGGFDAPTHVER